MTKNMLTILEKPVLVNGKEDFARSRRVELKIKVKNWDVSKALGLRK